MVYESSKAGPEIKVSGLAKAHLQLKAAVQALVSDFGSINTVEF